MCGAGTFGRMDYLQANIGVWQARREDQVALAQRAWASEPSWGEFSVPESDVGMLPPDLEGARAVELGSCSSSRSARSSSTSGSRWCGRRGSRSPCGTGSSTW
jgi:hypothetical protein